MFGGAAAEPPPPRGLEISIITESPKFALPNICMLAAATAEVVSGTGAEADTDAVEAEAEAKAMGDAALSSSALFGFEKRRSPYGRGGMG